MINRSEIRGSILAPASKSMTQRAVAAALLANGTSSICNPSHSDDAMAALDIAVALGARVELAPDRWNITGISSWRTTTVNCRESGLCTRLFLPVLTTKGPVVKMTGCGTLLNRPLFGLPQALKPFGVDVALTNGYLPLVARGLLHSAEATIDASHSSQVLSGLLMALPLVNGDSLLQVKNMVSRAYADMTVELLRAFGINIKNTNYELFEIKGMQEYIPCIYEVEGDWSGAAFWMVVAAINGQMTIHGLRKATNQPDSAILKVLENVGTAVSWEGSNVTVQHCTTRPFRFDATDCPDLFPPLVLLAAFCSGNSTISGVHRLRHKESDRAKALQETFGKLGVPVIIENDAMIVRGGQELHGGNVSSFHDHRIAMAAACASLFSTEEIRIDDMDCIKKSYPAFMAEWRKRSGQEIN